VHLHGDILKTDFRKPTLNTRAPDLPELLSLQRLEPPFSRVQQIRWQGIDPANKPFNASMRLIDSSGVAASPTFPLLKFVR
jgi:hypothetical protein